MPKRHVKNPHKRHTQKTKKGHARQKNLDKKAGDTEAMENEVDYNTRGGDGRPADFNQVGNENEESQELHKFYQQRSEREQDQLRNETKGIAHLKSVLVQKWKSSREEAREYVWNYMRSRNIPETYVTQVRSNPKDFIDFICGSSPTNSRFDLKTPNENIYRRAALLILMCKFYHNFYEIQDTKETITFKPFTVPNEFYTLYYVDNPKGKNLARIPKFRFMLKFQETPTFKTIIKRPHTLPRGVLPILHKYQFAAPVRQLNGSHGEATNSDDVRVLLLAEGINPALALDLCYTEYCCIFRHGIDIFVSFEAASGTLLYRKLERHIIHPDFYPQGFFKKGEYDVVFFPVDRRKEQFFKIRYFDGTLSNLPAPVPHVFSDSHWTSITPRNNQPPHLVGWHVCSQLNGTHGEFTDDDDLHSMYDMLSVYFYLNQIRAFWCFIESREQFSHFGTKLELNGAHGEYTNGDDFIMTFILIATYLFLRQHFSKSHYILPALYLGDKQDCMIADLVFFPILVLGLTNLVFFVQLCLFRPWKYRDNIVVLVTIYLASFVVSVYYFHEMKNMVIQAILTALLGLVKEHKKTVCYIIKRFVSALNGPNGEWTCSDDVDHPNRARLALENAHRRHVDAYRARINGQRDDHENPDMREREPGQPNQRRVDQAAMLAVAERLDQEDAFEVRPADPQVVARLIEPEPIERAEPLPPYAPGAVDAHAEVPVGAVDFIEVRENDHPVRLILELKDVYYSHIFTQAALLVLFVFALVSKLLQGIDQALANFGRPGVFAMEIAIYNLFYANVMLYINAFFVVCNRQFGLGYDAIEVTDVDVSAVHHHLLSHDFLSTSQYNCRKRVTICVNLYEYLMRAHAGSTPNEHTPGNLRYTAWQYQHVTALNNFNLNIIPHTVQAVLNHIVADHVSLMRNSNLEQLKVRQ